jgi:glutamate synthase domain-containing protein 2
MAKYICGVCTYPYDESKTPLKFSELPDDWTCPICESMKVYFEAAAEEETEPEPVSAPAAAPSISYPSDMLRTNDLTEKHMDAIHEMAVSGEPVVEPMRTRLPVISWDDILIKGAQLAVQPMDNDSEINTTTIIGKNAEKPMEISMPFYVSHMSYGALSKETHEALSMGTAIVKTAMCSGEGGILPESMDNAYKFIFEYVPNKYSLTDENLRNSDAIEIKIGQGTKPGLGGHLPGKKVTEDIALVRGKEVGKDVHSPSRIPGIETGDDLKNLVNELRKRSEGRPIGIKIAAGDIEADLEYALSSGPDFITIDGRGGATGSTVKMIKDATSVPSLFALYRARKYLDSANSDVDLVITGGLRVSMDIAKALAMGADAVALATASLMAVACQQYRICDTGKCPMGVATQDTDLRKRLKVDAGAQRLANFYTVTNEELKKFARLTGVDDVHKIPRTCLCTVNSEISNHTDIKHV